MPSLHEADEVNEHMMREIKTVAGFLAYYLRAVNRHGIQAPFAYQLNEAVFRSDATEGLHRDFELYRKQLLNDHSEIDLRDFGAGFGGTKCNRRTVSYVVRNSAKQPRYARMLYRLVRFLKPGIILELGTSAGISTLYMAAGHTEAKVVTVEGCASTADLARKTFSKFSGYDISLYEGRFEDVIPGQALTLPRIDFLFIDGNHRFQPTIDYVNLCFPLLSSGAVIVVDDINWSQEMKEAWLSLKGDSRFTLSIDLYMMGLLFISKNLSKQDLVVRY